MKQAILERYGKPEEGVRCVDGPDVTPVTRLIIARTDARLAEPMGYRAAIFHHVGDDVLTKVMT